MNRIASHPGAGFRPGAAAFAGVGTPDRKRRTRESMKNCNMLIFMGDFPITRTLK